MSKSIILTGLRANNDLHIGNYFGALMPIVDKSRQTSAPHDIYLFVPDLHSFTTPIDTTNLYSQTIQNLKVYVAAGLDIEADNIYIYRQSYIPAHSELTWILDCFVGFGELERMTQFKDKSAALGSNRVSVGLFNYPVLMAADILLYSASYVPVGDDQTQHIEFTRNLAERMNNRFGQLFVIPKSVKEQHQFFGSDQGLRIKDLVDPTKKMSKSNEVSRGVIFLQERPDEAVKKIMSATTDSLKDIQYDVQRRPGISNLLQILALLEHQSLDEVIKQWEGKSNYGELKAVVAEKTKSFLIEFQSRLSEVNEKALNNKFVQSEKSVNEIAEATLFKVQKAVGLRP